MAEDEYDDGEELVLDPLNYEAWLMTARTLAEEFAAEKAASDG